MDFKNKPHDEQTFITDIGSKATVQRQTVGEESAAPANRALEQLGQACHPSPETSTRYMGSAAVHIYWNEMFRQVWFVSQTEPLVKFDCPEPLAAKGMDDLLGTLKAMYGHRRPQLRSGF